jgi:DsbC/DsbD-like thiol-disulfide interchange protein
MNCQFSRWLGIGSAVTALLVVAGLLVGVSGRADPPGSDLPTAPSGPKRSDAVVKVTAHGEKPGPDGKQAVTVALVMEKDWRVYANPVGLEDLAAVQTTVSLNARTKPQDVKIDYPAGKAIKDPDGEYRVYEDHAAIKATLRRAPGDAGPLEVTVKFQACNDVKKQCLMPATVRVTVP